MNRLKIPQQQISTTLRITHTEAFARIMLGSIIISATGYIFYFFRQSLALMGVTDPFLEMMLTFFMKFMLYLGPVFFTVFLTYYIWLCVRRQ